MAESLGSARAAVYSTLEGEQGEATMAEGLTINVDQNRTETVQGNETITIGKDRDREGARERDDHHRQEPDGDGSGERDGHRRP